MDEGALFEITSVDTYDGLQGDGRRALSRHL